MQLVALVFVIPWKALYMFRCTNHQECLKTVHA
jgi:hypothetical protein